MKPAVTAAATAITPTARIPAERGLGSEQLLSREAFSLTEQRSPRRFLASCCGLDQQKLCQNSAPYRRRTNYAAPAQRRLA